MEVKSVRRIIVLHEDGSLGMNATSGHEPPNFLCDAHDDWIVDELTYSGGIVFHDPDKKQKILEAVIQLKEKRELEIKIIRIKKTLKAYWPVALAIVIGIALVMLMPHLFHFLN